MAYFSTMEKLPEDINNAEYLNMTHEQQQNIKQIEKSQDTQINLSDFIPEPKSLSQVLRLSPVVREKWGISIRNELLGLFDNDTFDTTEKALPADEVIPVKCAFKAKLNSYGGLDKLTDNLKSHPHLVRRFDVEDAALLECKGLYPYEYITSHEKLTKTNLPLNGAILPLKLL